MTLLECRILTSTINVGNYWRDFIADNSTTMVYNFGSAYGNVKEWLVHAWFFHVDIVDCCFAFRQCTDFIASWTNCKQGCVLCTCKLET